jgi:hypothetical protein
METFIQPNTQPPWSAYGGKYTFVEKIFKQQLVSPNFNYQRGVPQFDRCIHEKKASETIRMGILRNGYYLQLNSTGINAACLFNQQELLSLKMDAFKVKINNGEKLAAYLTISIGKVDKIRCFVTASSYENLVDFFQQKPFRSKFELAIDPNPPLEQIKLVNILSEFGKPGK